MPDQSERTSSQQAGHNEVKGSVHGPVVQTDRVDSISFNGNGNGHPERWWVTTVAGLPSAAIIALALVLSNSDLEVPAVAIAGMAVIGLFSVIVVLWLLRKRLRRNLALTAHEKTLRRLRKQVYRQLSDQAHLRDAQWPQPLRLRWRPTSSAVERAYSRTERRDSELLRGELVEAVHGRSPASALAADFQDMSRRQLVVLGPPGAGKSTLASLFALAVIEQDSVEGPVPVLLSVAGWDPTEPAQEWCVRRVAEYYPALGTKGIFSRNRIRDLLKTRRIVPVLDGLDEMPPAVLDAALHGLDRAGRDGLRMVLTCRSAEFEEAVQEHGALSHAAVIDIEPIRVEDIAAYLVEPDSAGTERWSAVIESMRDDPAGPLAQALSTPLMISLARSIYKPPNTTPEELTGLKTKSAITNHLITNYLPTVYPGNKHAQERHWLSFLSHFLQEQGADPNFNWWLLARAVPRWALFVPIVLVSMASGALLLATYSALLDLAGSNSIIIDDLWIYGTSGATLGAALGILGGSRIVRATTSPKGPASPTPKPRRFNILRGTISDIHALSVIILALSTLTLIGAQIVNRDASLNMVLTIFGTLSEFMAFDSDVWLAAAFIVLIVFLVTLVINSLGFRSDSPIAAH